MSAAATPFYFAELADGPQLGETRVAPLAVAKCESAIAKCLPT
jgi:hypothetical protein